MEKLIGTDTSKVTLANTVTNEFATQANKLSAGADRSRLGR
jgi:hypothetical protein